jgi:hypothetical protein
MHLDTWAIQKWLRQIVLFGSGGKNFVADDGNR